MTSRLTSRSRSHDDHASITLATNNSELEDIPIEPLPNAIDESMEPTGTTPYSQQQQSSEQTLDGDNKSKFKDMFKMTIVLDNNGSVARDHVCIHTL